MKRVRFYMCLLVMLLLSVMAYGGINDLLPQPKSVEVISDDGEEGFVVLTGRLTCMQMPSERIQHAFQNLLEQELTTETGSPLLKIDMVSSVEGSRDYALAGFPDEAYRLSVSRESIVIQAISETGVIRAVQTLTQMAEGEDGRLPLCSITDWPAFKLRGWMHDVGRSYISFEELKHQIRLMGRFKVNTFHWHLTENQAWRFEVKQYPQLTKASSMTRFVGKYYTQEECRELVSLAADYGIQVIPEIDMPGHSKAFERAMGHSMQTEQGVTELKNILDEVCEVFAESPYIHIGADEQQITYPNFLKTITDYIHAKGKRVVVWNPISGVTISSSTGADMTQMWSTAGKKVSGLPNIDCRYNYINHFDVFADLVGIYKSNVYYAQQGSAEVAGEITAVWNDRYVETEESIMRQNNVYASVLASVDRAWKGGGKQYIEVGGTTLPSSGEEYDEFADWERRFLFHKAHSLVNEPISYVRQTNVRWQVSEGFPNEGSQTKAFPPETEGPQDSYSFNGKTYVTGRATGAGVYLRHTWGTTVPAYFSNPQLNTTAYAWTYVYSPVAQEAGALIEFQNYGRSEKDTAPANGKWDRKGSRIWFNDEEIKGPSWTNAGKSIDNEVPLKNENFTERQPVRIQLKQGWNKVFMKLPYVSASGVRLNKWMFTFVITDTEGRNALEGLVYSPKQLLDEEAEALSARIDEIRHDMSERLGTEPGFLPESLAQDLMSTIAEIESTLEDGLTAEERLSQKAQLNAAYDKFVSDCNTTKERIMPQVSDERMSYWYTMCTPLRNGRYVQSNGAGSGLTGGTDGTLHKAMWKFVTRNDGSYNIVNRGDNSYISPNASSDTQLSTTKNAPSKGWTLKAADTMGYLIVTCGSAQLNQTNPSLSYKIYNWGSGTNTSDTGCQFAIREVDITDGIEDVRMWGSEETSQFRHSLYDTQGRLVVEPKRAGLYVTNGKKIIIK